MCPPSTRVALTLVSASPAATVDRDRRSADRPNSAWLSKNCAAENANPLIRSKVTR